MEEAAPSFGRLDCLFWALLYPRPKAAAIGEPQFRGTVLVMPKPLLCARLSKGTGFSVREPVASPPQPGQLQSLQFHFTDGKRRLSQGLG